MKLQTEYPNFLSALLLIIDDKIPYRVSNDSTKLAYQIPLKNFKRGFDFYELNKSKDGSVFFSIVTMVGFKTICETNSNYIYNDLSVTDWQNEIFNLVFKHFSKEEYIALKKGYIKKGKSARVNEPQVLKNEIFEEKSDEKWVEPLNKDLEYLKNKPKSEWSKGEKFSKSSDEFLKLSLDLQSKQRNSGCMVVFLSLSFLMVIMTLSIFNKLF